LRLRIFLIRLLFPEVLAHLEFVFGVEEVKESDVLEVEGEEDWFNLKPGVPELDLPILSLIANENRDRCWLQDPGSRKVKDVTRSILLIRVLHGISIFVVHRRTH
jgi:hypothetical protein